VLIEALIGGFGALLVLVFVFASFLAVVPVDRRARRTGDVAVPIAHPSGALYAPVGSKRRTGSSSTHSSASIRLVGPRWIAYLALDLLEGQSIAELDATVRSAFSKRCACFGKANDGSRQYPALA